MNAQDKKGFTIIEVVLVLAIAGLIFLMIFIAWPALQRSQRDTGRKNDANVVASAIGNYRSDHRGTNPTTAALLGSYVTNLGQYQKSGSNWPILFVAAPPTTANLDNIYVVTGKKCDDTTGQLTSTGATARSIAVTYFTEAAGNSIVCQDA